MALKYKVEYNNTATIGDNTYKFKPWTTKNEKDYLIAVESEKNITDSMLFDLLIKPCLENPDIVLSQNEQKMLIIQIRKKSLGATFPMRYACTKCKQVNDIDVNFDSIVKYESADYRDVTVDNMVFKFNGIASERLRSRLDNQDTNIDYAFTEFLLHIESITIDGELEDTFTFDELQEFIEELPTYIFDEVYKEFQSMKSSLEFELKTFCMVCNEENNVEFDHLPNFLWT
jgi:hypothetical protein